MYISHISNIDIVLISNRGLIHNIFFLLLDVLHMMHIISMKLIKYVNLSAIKVTKYNLV